MKLIKQVKTTRPMNERELTLSLTTSTACHLLIRNLDGLSQTTFYNQKLKNYGKQFLYELEKHTNNHVWGSIEMEDIDKNKASDQSEEMGEFMQNLFIIGLGIGYISPDKLNSFWRDMQNIINNHNIPLNINTNGELSLKRITIKD